MGVLGVAADLVEASAALRPAVDLLLGQVIIVEDRQTARRILKGQDNNVRAVTLKGRSLLRLWRHHGRLGNAGGNTAPAAPAQIFTG